MNRKSGLNSPGSFGAVDPLGKALYHLASEGTLAASLCAFDPSQSDP